MKNRPDEYGGASITVEGNLGKVEIEMDVCTKSYNKDGNHNLFELVDVAIKAYEAMRNDK